MANKRPNILIIMSDQHAPAVAGFAGNSVIDTRHMDALAKRSVRFTTASCASPVCTASRMSMLTGKDIHHCSAWNNHWMIFPEHTTWPAHFSEHGYATCLVGKMHFGGRDQMQGFTHRPYGDLRHGLGHQPEPLNLYPGYHGAQSAGVTEIPESLISDVVTTRESLSFVLEHEDQQPQKPWFLCASYTRPHAPHTAPGRYLRKYKDRVPEIDPPPALDSMEPYARQLMKRSGSDKLTAQQHKTGREGYYACLDFVDDCIGELLDGLAKAGSLDNTIVIYTSDHGEMAGHHGLWGKTIYFEESMGVPLLISGPGIAVGAEAHDPISLIDLFPTTCGLAGIPMPQGLDGVDQSCVLKDPASPGPRDFAPCSYFTYGVRINYNNANKFDTPHSAMRAVRTRGWKYIEIQDGSPILFDMTNDPGEQTNLAAAPEHARRCKEMKTMLFEGFSWQQVHQQIASDLKRVPEFLSGQKPTTPNQYRLPDGREFDAEASLCEARWLYLPEGMTGGVIPQMRG